MFARNDKIIDEYWQCLQGWQTFLALFLFIGLDRKIDEELDYFMM